MRRLLLFLLLTSSFHYALSQDRLHRELRVVKEDTSKARILNQLANYHKFSRADSGIYYATKALSLSRSLGNVLQETVALNYLSISYATLGNNAAAMRINLEELRIAERSGSPGAVAQACQSLGSRYFQFGNLSASIEFNQRALSLFKSQHNNYFIPISCAGLSRVFFALGQLDSAFFYAYKSKQLAEVDSVNWVLSPIYNRLATMHGDLGNADSAFYYFRKSLPLTVGSQAGRSSRELELAKLFQSIGQMDSCMFYANDALRIAQKNKLYNQMRDVSLFLAGLYEKEDPSRALQFSKYAIASADTLTRMASMSAYTDFIDFDEQQRQYELAAAEKEYQSSLRTNTLLGSTFTLVIIAFLLYRNNRQKQKAKGQIEVAYDQLKATQSQLIQSEKMASLGELTAGIAHEIQNPLNFVNNFSEVNSELTEELSHAARRGDLNEVSRLAANIKENEEKIVNHGKRADAIVKSMLQHSRKGSGHKEPTDINALCDEYLRLSYHGLRAKDKSFNAKFETNFDPSVGQISVLPQEIGRVILNLINNAFYAVSEKKKLHPENYEPTVIVSTSLSSGEGRGEARVVQITVSDNGNGIPAHIKDKIFQPFFTTKPTGQGTGLGLSLSYDIVTKGHQGELKLLTKEGEGSEFVVSLPTA